MTARFAAVALCVLLHLLSSPFVRAQDFWNIPPSPEALGRGGTYFSTDTDDPLAPLSNPGMLGFLAERNRLVIGLYPVNAGWTELPSYESGYDPLHFSFARRAVVVGLDRATIGKIFHSRSSFSVGFGYQEVSYSWTIENPFHRPYYESPNSHGVSDHTFSFGLGYHGKILQAGIGMNHRYISPLYGYYGYDGYYENYDTRHVVGDYGIVVRSRVDRLFWEDDSTRTWQTSITPMISYVASNGQYNSDYNGGFPDQKLFVGFGLSVDLRSKHVAKGRVPVVSVAVGKLLGYDTDSRGLTPYVELEPQIARKQGIEISLLEIGSVRWGYVESANNSYSFYDENYSTNGYGLRLSGITKLLAMNQVMCNPSFFAILARHFDLQYQYSARTGRSGRQPINDGTSFHEIVVLLK